MKVVSLTQVCKAKARDAARVQADANAVKFGRTKAERAQDQAKADKARRDLEGHAKE